MFSSDKCAVKLFFFDEYLASIVCVQGRGKVTYRADDEKQCEEAGS